MRRLGGVLVMVVLVAGVFAVGARADEFGRYALESVSVGLSSTQAGAHPDFTTTFKLNEDAGGYPYALTRDVQVRLPAGLFGNPEAFPVCTALELGTTTESSHCPFDSQVGVSEITLGGAVRGTFTEPVYNMPPRGGDVIARFGFFAGPYPALINVRLDPADDTLVATAESAPAAAGLIAASTTLWGVPAAASHDVERITPAEATKGGGPVGGRKSSLPETPFMTNPTSCGLSRQVSFKLTSYQTPVAPVAEASAAFPAISGCSAVGFSPSVAVSPTSEAAYTGTGLDYEASFPAKGLEHGSLLYDSEAKRVEVTLPEGMTVNPSEAVGLGVCSEADLERETYDSPPNAGCPESSKIGTITAPTPVLKEVPEGSLYLAAPYANRFHSLLALYLVVKVPNRGLLVKLQGEVRPNPQTGQLTTVFDDIPQLPVGSFRLHFREGARAPLITPPVCGTFTTTSRMEPWSALGFDLLKQSTFQITKGIDNGPCPTGGTPPFKPGFVAGMANAQAGAYSPLELRITREDGEQEITGFSTLMPPGLTGRLAGVPFCPEADIQRAREQTGAQAEAEPACPAASEIGHTLVGAGVGGVLAYTPGRLYLAGPFEGAPFSIVSVTAAKVGPFDLGTVVVHLPLNVDPTTAQVSIPQGAADQIPHIIDGIVVHVRDIRVEVDRPGFMINPTDCKPLSLTATVYGSGKDFASPADDQAATVSERFQAANCAYLAFNPTFKASTNGKTSRKRGASLRVRITTPKNALGNDANIREVKVKLPRELPSYLATLQKACTSKQFEVDPVGCPSGSVVGHAKALTPILPVPLTGKAYFVSNGVLKYPELVLVLKGYGITIELHGETYISKKGITSSTFKTVPDQPVESFELTLPQGPNHALAAPVSLCWKHITKTKRVLVRHHGHLIKRHGHYLHRTKRIHRKVRRKLKMPLLMIAQNGAQIERNETIHVTGCGHSKHTSRKAGHRSHRSHTRRHRRRRS